MPECYRHPDKEAVETCADCARFICEECKIEVKRKFYCPGCIEEMMARRARESVLGPGFPAQSLKKQRKLSLIYLIVLVLILLIVFILYIFGVFG